MSRGSRPAVESLEFIYKATLDRVTDFDGAYSIMLSRYGISVGSAIGP